MDYSYLNDYSDQALATKYMSMSFMVIPEGSVIAEEFKALVTVCEQRGLLE